MPGDRTSVCDDESSRAEIEDLAHALAATNQDVPQDAPKATHTVRTQVLKTSRKTSLSSRIPRHSGHLHSAGYPAAPDRDVLGTSWDVLRDVLGAACSFAGIFHGSTGDSAVSVVGTLNASATSCASSGRGA